MRGNYFRDVSLSWSVVAVIWAVSALANAITTERWVLAYVAAAVLVFGNLPMLLSDFRKYRRREIDLDRERSLNKIFR